MGNENDTIWLPPIGSLPPCPRCGAENPLGNRFCGTCGAALTTRCALCGAPNPLGKSYCGDCGAPVSLQTPGGESTASPPSPSSPPASEQDPGGSSFRSPIPQRPVWLVVALSMATFGLYLPVWLGLTWAQMRRELPEAKMDPVAHVLVAFIPIYGWTRLQAHQSVVNTLRRRAGLEGGLAPGLFMLVWLGLAVIGLSFVIAGQSQAALNAYWRAVGGDGARPRVRPAEWATLALATPVAAVVLLAVLAGLLSAGEEPTDLARVPTPAPRVSTRTPPPPTPRLMAQVGATVYAGDAVTIPLRAAPSNDAETLVLMHTDRKLVITGPYLVVTDRVWGGQDIWWPVRDAETGTTGYVLDWLLKQ